MHDFICVTCGKPGKAARASTRRHAECYQNRPCQKPRNRKTYPFICAICGLPGASQDPRVRHHGQCYQDRPKLFVRQPIHQFICRHCGLPGQAIHAGRTSHWECHAHKNDSWRKASCEHCGAVKTTRYQRRFCSRQCAKAYGKPTEFNPRYFEQDDPQVAYHAGMLLADGNLFTYGESSARLSIHLNARDREYLELLRTDLGALSNGIRERMESGGFGAGPSSMVTFSVSHPCFVEGLRRWGIVPRKTTEPALPDPMSDELVPHFLRGLIDGDGSIGMYPRKGPGSLQLHVGLACHPMIADWVMDRSPLRCYKSKQAARSKVPLCYLAWCGWNQVPELLRWTGYGDDSLPALSRKRGTALRILAAASAA